MEEEAALNGLNGINGINGLNGVNGMNVVNGMNGVNGMMNGHSDYPARHAENIRRRKSDLMNYPMPRFRCAQYVPTNGYSPFPTNHYYPSDVSRYGPVGTRIMPDIDRFSGFSHYPSSQLSPRAATLIEGRVDFIHNASFHPHPFREERIMFRSPHNPDTAEVSFFS